MFLHSLFSIFTPKKLDFCLIWVEYEMHSVLVTFTTKCHFALPTSRILANTMGFFKNNFITTEQSLTYNLPKLCLFFIFLFFPPQFQLLPGKYDKHNLNHCMPYQGLPCDKNSLQFQNQQVSNMHILYSGAICSLHKLSLHLCTSHRLKRYF